MTDKRFKLSYPNGAYLIDGDKPLCSIENDLMIVDLLNELAEENHKIKSILLQRMEELNDAYNKSAKAGMPTGGIIGELDSFEEICEAMGWLE